MNSHSHLDSPNNEAKAKQKLLSMCLCFDIRTRNNNIHSQCHWWKYYMYFWIKLHWTNHIIHIFISNSVFTVWIFNLVLQINNKWKTIGRKHCVFSLIFRGNRCCWPARSVSTGDYSMCCWGIVNATQELLS